MGEFAKGEQAGLRSFLRHVLWVASVFAVALGALAFRYHAPELYLSAGNLVFMGLATLSSQFLLRRGKTSIAATLIAYSILLYGVADARMVGWIGPVSVLAPPLAVAAMLPYVRGRALALMVTCALLGQIIILGGPHPTIAVPASLLGPLVYAALCSATFLLLVLLIQFSSRLRGLLDNAQSSVKMHEEFLSIAAHELRTPLTTLKLRMQTLRPSSRKPTAQETADHLARAERQVDRLARLVEQLLDMSRLQNGKMELEPSPVDLGELTSEVMGHFKEEQARSGSELTLHAGSTVVGHWDRARLEQVVTNLISNALKYGKGNPISISLLPAADMALLAVEDRGIGIAQRDLPNLFTRFQRAASARNFGGLGLGLSISKDIVQAMGGAIEVESVEAEGSVFTVRLPLAPKYPKPPPPTSPSSHQ